MAPKQEYLRPAPLGIDACFAWRIPGGDGAGVRFSDVEGGWNLEHADLRPHGISVQGQSAGDLDARNHGTAALAIVLGWDHPQDPSRSDGGGFIGIVPRVACDRVFSERAEGGALDMAGAIDEAGASLREGDVLLLEIQTQAWVDVGGERVLRHVPIELYPGCFDVIRTHVERGVAIVEPAGNGGVSVDLLLGERGDSGAIVVGAAVPATRVRHRASGHGARVDCYAWGEGVWTALGVSSTGDSTFTQTFGGTSAASAIVAGAAVATQGMARALVGAPLWPSELRRVLATYGTDSADPATDRVGRMPDLRRIATDYFGWAKPG